MNLRPYQSDAIGAVLSYWQSGGENPLVEMATGTGKSLVQAALLRRLIGDYPDMRVVCLVHVRELVEQNAMAILRAWPGAPIGINSAGLGRRDKRSQILFASIQSIHREDAYSLGERDLVLIDEAHLVPHDGEGMYRTFIGRLRERVPDLRIAGFTATPYRTNGGRIDLGDGAIFNEIVYKYGIAAGIKDGFLSPLISKATAAQIDVSVVKRTKGEFVQAALERAVDTDETTAAAVREIVAYGAERRSWVVFCAGVDHALHVRDALKASGVSAETVSTKTEKGERTRILRAFKAGQIRCLTNCSVLTTGFDAPQIDLIAMLRPTLSPGLFVQMVGRGTRIAPGKADCLVLDFAGNVKRHGPVDTIGVGYGNVAAGKDAEKEVRAKECPNCMALIALGYRTCPHCDHEFPPPEDDGPKHDAHADSERSILSNAPPAWVAVSGMRFYRHEKICRTPTLRVEYSCGLAVHREWVGFESLTGPGRERARQWWMKHGGKTPAPETVDEARQRSRELTWPAEILVKPSGKYFEVVGARGRAREAA